MCGRFIRMNSQLNKNRKSFFIKNKVMKIIKIAILSENQPKNVLSCENCLGSVYITF